MNRSDIWMLIEAEKAQRGRRLSEAELIKQSTRTAKRLTPFLAAFGTVLAVVGLIFKG